MGRYLTTVALLDVTAIYSKKVFQLCYLNFAIIAENPEKLDINYRSKIT